jgi:alginate O-acetyltransferase complex protein AlgI
MLFNSFAFLVFFLIVTTLFFFLKHRFRWILLLTASCIFYAFFKWEYIFILLFTIIVDYYAGIKIEKATSKRSKRFYLILSLIANIGVLAFFKYYNFVNENMVHLADCLGFEIHSAALNIILPIGLSFHTFQAMSYTIEVYRGNQRAERHFGLYALYVMFYPQLVAGPIERPQNVLPQLHEVKRFSYDNITSGLKLIGWGLFKKIVIADRLADYVNTLYNSPDNFHGLQVIIPIFLFSYQIYCDFSGYSDIALGTAKVMGYDLMVNFNRPYHSRTISEFWTRWHISLSTWFKDYLYIPLGGSRASTLKWVRNILIVFCLSGLWHGASWNFIIWGFIHAFFILVWSLVIKNHRAGRNGVLVNLFGAVITFVLVSFAWIFFRAETFNVSVIVLRNAIHHLTSDLSLFLSDTNEAIRKFVYLGKGQDRFVICAASLVILESVEYLRRNKNVFYFFQDRHTVCKWSFYLGLTTWIMLFGVYQDKNSFIYFQF